MTISATIEAEILRVAREHGATEVRVFGSRARGDAQEESDLDLLVTFEDGRGLFDLVAIKQDIEEILRLRVDVVTTGGLSPDIRDAVLAEAVTLGATHQNSELRLLPDARH